MILTDIYNASTTKKETKKIGDFFDESIIDNKELLDISDNSINGDLLENTNTGDSSLFDAGLAPF